MFAGSESGRSVFKVSVVLLSVTRRVTMCSQLFWQVNVVYPQRLTLD